MVFISKSTAACLMLAAALILLPVQHSRAAPAIAVSGSARERSILPSQEAVAYQINVGHSGNIAFTTPLTTPLKQLWSVKLGGSVSYPLVAQNSVFVIVNNNELFAINVTTGKTRWEKLLSGNWNAAAVDGSSIFDLNDSGELLALRTGNGQQLWDTTLPNEYFFSSAPTAEDGMIFVGGSGDAGLLYGVDELNGNVAWSQFVQNGDSSSPALGASKVFVSYTCQYYAFAAATGKSIWYDNGVCEGGGGATPVLFGNNVYVEDTFLGNSVFNAKTGVLIDGFAGTPTPAFFTASNNVSYMLTLTECAGRSSCTLFCVNAATGNVVWSFTGDGALSASPIVVNGLVVIGSTAGHLYVLNGLTGVQQWSASLPTGETTNMAAGQQTIVVPAGNTLTAYVAQ